MWVEYKERTIKGFALAITATHQVAMIRMRKQDRNKRVTDFKNRLQLQFEALEDRALDRARNKQEMAHDKWSHTKY